jgi:hypothetical protein
MSEHEAIGNGALIAFYTARLDEDEATAKAQAALDEAQGIFSSAGASFGARFTPARVLRDVEAGRHLVAKFEAADEAFSQQVAEANQGGMPAYVDTEHGLLVAPDRVAEILDSLGPEVLVWDALLAEVKRRAAVWSDHPDYQPGWAPDDDGSSG